MKLYTDFSSVGRAFDCRSIVVIKLSLVRFQQVGKKGTRGSPLFLFLKGRK